MSAAIPLTLRYRLEAEANRSGESLSAVIRNAIDYYTMLNYNGT